MRILLTVLFLSLAFGQPRETPYRRWVTEDVVYIISAAERAAFNGLVKDWERQRFIEQFWLQRDPSPDTLENEYKEEHYRRIAYANEHFASTKTAGWKTDRGRMYIVYGPPDEIESHPPARESWRYHRLEGIGVNVTMDFSDPKGTGEFPMTIDPRAK